MLQEVLPIARDKIGADELARVLNIKVGKKEVQLGAVDTALRSSVAVARLLKQYGGREQCAPPDDWKKGRRRQTDIGYNQRSDHKHSGSGSASYGGGTWEQGSWQQWQQRLQ